MWHHKLRKGGLGAKVLADVGSELNAGIAGLPEDITINGTTVSPTFRYEGKDATLSSWTPVVGETLTAAGSGGTVGLHVPTPDETARAVNGQAVRRWEASDLSLGQIGTEDFVFECVVRPIHVVSRYIFGTRISAVGWLLFSDTSGTLKFFIQDSGGFSQQTATVSDSAWHHYIVFADRSGSLQAYVDGDASGSPLLITSRSGDLDSGAAFTIAARSSGTLGSRDDIAYCSLWKQASWLDTHLQPDLAQERFARLTGSYAPGWQAWPTQANLRNSVATLTRRFYGNESQLFTVGTRWPRLENPRDGVTDRDDDGTVRNAFAYSEDFTDASWTKTRVSIDNSTGVYDHTGTVEMHGIIADSGTNSHYIRGDQTPSSNWKHIVTAEFAAGDTDAVRIQSQNAGAADVWCQFGLRGDGVQGLDSGNLLGAGIELLSTGRYRCYITYDGGTANHQHRFYVINDETVDDVASHVGDGSTVNVYITAAGHDYAEATDGRETPAEYVRTVGVGRTVGRPGVGFLCEGQHTNLLTYSEDISNAAWTKTRTTVGADSGVAPDLETTMDTIAEDGTAASTHYIEQSFTQSAAAHTFMAVVETINRDFVQLELSSATDGAASSYFSIAGQAVGTESGNDDAGIMHIRRGLYLVWLTDTRATAEACAARIYVADADNSNSFDGLTQDSVRVWGMQVTATAYPVSYIKTEGATVTRLVDSIQYRPGSLPVDMAIACDALTYAPVSGASDYFAEVSDDTSANRAIVYNFNGNLISLQRSNSANVAVIGAAVLETYTWQELRGLYEQDNARLFVDGVLAVPADTSCDSLVAANALSIGIAYNGGNPLDGHVRVRLFSKPTTKNVTEFE